MHRYALCLLLVLAACGTADTKKLTAGPEGVSYSWDRDGNSMDDLTRMAERHCREFGRRASLVSNSAASQSGTFFNTVFACVPPS